MKHTEGLKLNKDGGKQPIDTILQIYTGFSQLSLQNKLFFPSCGCLHASEFMYTFVFSPCVIKLIKSKLGVVKIKLNKNGFLQYLSNSLSSVRGIDIYSSPGHTPGQLSQSTTLLSIY